MRRGEGRGGEKRRGGKGGGEETESDRDKEVSKESDREMKQNKNKKPFTPLSAERRKSLNFEPLQ